MTNLPRLLLWTNNTGPYIDAMREAGWMIVSPSRRCR